MAETCQQYYQKSLIKKAGTIMLLPICMNQVIP